MVLMGSISIAILNQIMTKMTVKTSTTLVITPMIPPRHWIMMNYHIINAIQCTLSPQRALQLPPHHLKHPQLVIICTNWISICAHICTTRATIRIKPVITLGNKLWRLNCPISIAILVHPFHPVTSTNTTLKPAIVTI